MPRSFDSPAQVECLHALLANVLTKNCNGLCSHLLMITYGVCTYLVQHKDHVVSVWPTLQ